MCTEYIYLLCDYIPRRIYIWIGDKLSTEKRIVRRTCLCVDVCMCVCVFAYVLVTMILPEGRVRPRETQRQRAGTMPYRVTLSTPVGCG